MHTAGRRYCMERRAFWCARYAEMVRAGGDRENDGYHYTPEALATFPRYNVLAAIRVELEKLDPIQLPGVEETRELLVLAGRIAQSGFTQAMGPIDARAMQEEREAFCRYIEELGLSDLAMVTPLPYRRALSAGESEAVWRRLEIRWQISRDDHYWYPLSDSAPPEVAAFKADRFAEAATKKELQRILAGHGIERLWEMREDSENYELEVALFEPCYNGAEGFWSAGELDWIIYASHENSVTVGGWLLGEVKAIWPEWQTHVWTGIFD
jgi:hypothetical protein